MNLEPRARVGAAHNKIALLAPWAGGEPSGVGVRHIAKLDYEKDIR